MASYAAVETALGMMHGASLEARKGAFRGRLKHLQRLGLPLGNKPGKGKRINYNKDDILQLAIALELEQCGLDPVVITKYIANFWQSHLKNILIEAENSERHSDDVLLIITLAIMSAAWEPPGWTFEGLISMASHKISGISLHGLRKNKRRALLINLTDMILNLREGIENLDEA